MEDKDTSHIGDWIDWALSGSVETYVLVGFIALVIVNRIRNGPSTGKRGSRWDGGSWNDD
ncbi:MAG: hypothetical protein AAFW64_08005 [Pseudomonadota bacterium]